MFTHWRCIGLFERRSNDRWWTVQTEGPFTLRGKSARVGCDSSDARSHCTTRVSVVSLNGVITFNDISITCSGNAPIRSCPVCGTPRCVNGPLHGRKKWCATCCFSNTKNSEMYIAHCWNHAGSGTLRMNTVSQIQGLQGQGQRNFIAWGFIGGRVCRGL